jgi:2,3-bisphosphoglycerate-dependent phosphoglycerate mutase
MPEAVDKGKRVLIASSENAIRGMLMHLCDIPEERISELNVPNGVPIVYDIASRTVKLMQDEDGEDPLLKYDFGKAAEFLFREAGPISSSNESEQCDIESIPEETMTKLTKIYTEAKQVVIAEES